MRWACITNGKLVKGAPNGTVDIPWWMCYLTSESRLLGQLSTASCVNHFEQALLADITNLFPSDTHFYCNISGSNNVHSAAFMLMCLVFTYVCFLPTSVRVRAECDWCSLCGSYGALCSFIHCCWKADWQTGKIYVSVGTLLKITPPTVFCAACCFVFYMPSLIPRLGGSPQRAWERGYTMPWNGICPQPFHPADNTV